MDSKAKVMTPDEVVSLNLGRARELRGWTQPEAAQNVSRYLGREWSAQVYGDAERAWRLKRVKVFSAEEIIALCRAFRLPLVWFYLPPDPWTVIAPRGAAAGDAPAAMTGDDLLSLLFPRPDDPMTGELEDATEKIFSKFANQGPTRENLPTFLAWAQRQNAALRMMMVSAFRTYGVEDVAKRLREDADRIDAALGLVVNDLRHDGIPPAGDDQGPVPAVSLSATNTTRLKAPRRPSRP